MNRNNRTPYKIAIGFVILALIAVYGYRWANDYRLGGKVDPIPPGQINILGVDTRAGYGIVVSNRIAKLVYGGSDFAAGRMDDKSLDDSGGEKVPIPIKEMLKGLQGDEAAMGYFVMRLNKINDADFPPNPARWKNEDIEKALSGDPTLKKNLERDLNMRLDGAPLDHLSKNALFNGILIDIPVPIKVTTAGPTRTIIARVLRPFRARMILDVENSLKERMFTEETMSIEYAAAAKRFKDSPNSMEDLAASLRKLYSQSELAKLAETPTRTINSVNPVVNELQITGARYVSQEGDKGEKFSLYIKLSDEGRKRVWQFTRDRVNSQLLVTVNGVAIAAPFVQHGIADEEVQISGLEDEAIVQDTVEAITKRKAS